jgi:hypothetical protein
VISCVNSVEPLQMWHQFDDDPTILLADEHLSQCLDSGLLS